MQSASRRPAGSRSGIVASSGSGCADRGRGDRGTAKSETHYERLSALDAHFLELEDEGVHMHVAVVLVCDARPLTLDDGRLDIEKIRSFLESRLDAIPRYRQRLARIPVERHPIWIDDPSFNIQFHVRHVSLPRPGDERQLKRLVGMLMSQKLDHGKPLWEMWVIEGLEGERFAVLARCHHCMVDGIAGVGILRQLLRTEPDASFRPGRRWRPRPAPDAARLVGEAFARRVREPLDLAAAARRALANPTRALRSAWDATVGLGESLTALRPASPTFLNPPHIGPHRRMDWLRFDLDAARAAGRCVGATLNDVVLATVAGAMRSHLRAHREPVGKLDFRVFCPVSVRHEGETAGNRVVMLVAPLPIDERDPRRRLERIAATTRELKASRAPQCAELIEEIADWTTSSLVTETIKLTTRLRVFNLIVTNVPGPPVSLHLLGAPVLATIPLVPLYENQAFGIALLSYVGGLYWGLSSDWDRVPDLHDIARRLEASFEELRAAL